jgi:transcriptional regulator with AAA-type ATPase domain
MRPAGRLIHPALDPGLDLLPLAEARLTGRQRLAVVLQAAGLMSLLDRAGWHLPTGWSDAGVTTGVTTLGCLALRRPRAVAPGRAVQLPQELLRELLGVLFGATGPGGEKGEPGRLAGRGEALRAARELLAAWRQTLVPIAPDAAVALVLEAAPFLWGPAFGAARRALAGGIEWDEALAARPAAPDPATNAGLAASASPGLPAPAGRLLWVAGSGRFRRRLLAGTPDLATLAARLATAEAESLWYGEEEGPPLALAAARRWRAAVAAWRRAPPGGEAESRELAAALFALGRFEAALRALERGRAAASRALRLRCQIQLGRLGAARVTLRALAASPLAAPTLVEVADAAVRLLANVGDSPAAAGWVERALAAGEQAADAATSLRAQLVAALAAWDREDTAAMDRHLARAESALPRVPDLRWRFQHALGLRAMAASQGDLVVRHLALALGAGRRLLARHEAAGLWNDLGVGRAQAGDLPGAERAFLHALRLFAGCDGPRATTLALHNLAEVRLRRGRLAGVHDILERSAAANRLSGNLRGLAQDGELLARHELLLGRPAAALALARGASDELARHGSLWHRAELSLLAARALGWLGRAAEAAAALAALPPPGAGDFDAEELPALWAHAGAAETARARAEALPPPLGKLWQRALSPQPPTPLDALWTALAALPAHRAARLAYDLELLRPGVVPASWRRAAVETFRRLGGEPPAVLLETDSAAAWHALEAYAVRPAGDAAALAALFAAAGYPEAELEWWPAGSPVDRAEHPSDPLPFPSLDRSSSTSPSPATPRLEARLENGLLRLTARRIDDTLVALFALAQRDVASSSPSASPMPGAFGASSVREPAQHGRGAWDGEAGMIGRSPRFRAAMARLARLARADIPVLILGETGTGKELAARRIHQASPRAGAPFLAVNCAALSETLLLADLFGHVRGAFTGADRDRAGVFESAHGGTVFLDEIGDLPPPAQGMLLRVLQEGEVRRLGESLARRVDVRVLAATHRDLMRAVEAGAFRQDLFYRLRVGSIELPPLRERGDDVQLLADHFIARLARSAGRSTRLTNEARGLLSAHRWPGNVRELENRLRLAAALADGSLGAEHLDLPAAPAAAPPAAPTYHREVDSLRRRLVAEALSTCGGNGAEAARRLGLTRQALSYLVRRLGLA